MERHPHPEEATNASASNGVEAANGHPDGGETSAAKPLAPDQPVPLLESSGEFSCPHCGDTIRLEGIGLRFEGGDDADTVRLDLRHPDDPLDEVVDDVRRVLAIRALREANGVKVKAAEIAGMKYTTFYELVRRLGITEEDYKS